MAPKRSSRSGSGSSNDVPLDADEFTPFSGRRYRLGQDGVLRDVTVVAHIEVHESDDDQDMDDHLERLDTLQMLAGAWIRMLRLHPHPADLPDAIHNVIRGIAGMVSKLKATRITRKDAHEIRELVQRWHELHQIVDPIISAPIDHRKRLRGNDDVAPNRRVSIPPWPVPTMSPTVAAPSRPVPTRSPTVAARSRSVPTMSPTVAAHYSHPTKPYKAEHE